MADREDHDDRHDSEASSARSIPLVDQRCRLEIIHVRVLLFPVNVRRTGRGRAAFVFESLLITNSTVNANPCTQDQAINWPWGGSIPRRGRVPSGYAI